MYQFTWSKSYLDRKLDCDLEHNPEDVPFYTGHQDIHCSIQQSTSHCYSLFIVTLIAIHIISGLKLSRLRSRSIVYTGQNISIQIANEIVIWMIVFHVNAVFNSSLTKSSLKQ